MMRCITKFFILSAMSVVVLCMGCSKAVQSTSYSPPDVQPVFDPPGDNNWTTPHTVTISDVVAGSSFYYTTDGSGPTTSSTLYTAPITISQTETLRAIAIAPGYTASIPSTETYTIFTTGPALAPVISPAAQAGSSLPITVTISDAMSGAAIYYTTDGTVPTQESTLYTGPFAVNATETVKAVAVVQGHQSSGVARADYTIAGTEDK